MGRHAASTVPGDGDGDAGGSRRRFAAALGACRLRRSRPRARRRCPVRKRRAAISVALVCALVGMHAQTAFAYLEFGVRVGGRNLTLKWTQKPVRYFVSDAASVAGVSIGDFQAAVGRAFNTWQAVPTSAITYQFAGFTSAIPGDEDGLSTLGFRNRPDLDRVLASTSFVIDTSTGAL